jgi:hypothetical protein
LALLAAARHGRPSAGEKTLTRLGWQTRAGHTTGRAGGPVTTRRAAVRRRWLTVPLLAGVTLATTAGCAGSIKNRELVAYFKGGTTSAELQAVARACRHVSPDITPAPNPTPSGSEAGLAGNSDEIRFEVGSSDDHDIALLTDCLSRQPRVLGVQPPDDDMS